METSVEGIKEENVESLQTHDCFSLDPSNCDFEEDNGENPEPEPHILYPVCVYDTETQEFLKQRPANRSTEQKEKVFRCEFCQYKCVRKQNLRQHVRKHTGERPYQCNFCSYSTACSSYLKMHKRKHTGEKPYECEHCKYKTGQLSAFIRHKKIHTKEKPHKCDVCEYTTSRLSNLNRHKLTCHVKTDKTHKCDQCGFFTAQEVNLKRHKKNCYSRKTIEDSVVCTDNLAPTSTKDEGENLSDDLLAEGMSQRARRAERRAVRAATTAPEPSSYLKMHKRKHTEEKPYECEHCKYKTCQLGAFTRHKKIHTKDKPHKCDVCEYTTSRLSNLIRHKLLCHEKTDKTHKCDQCGFFTAQEVNLERHKKNCYSRKTIN